MEINITTFRRLIGLVVLLLIANIIMSIYAAFRSKGPSATDLINDAMEKINIAVNKIDSAKVEIKNVYENLDSTKQTLINLNGNIKSIRADYAKRSAIIRREINYSNIKITELKKELEKEQTSMDALREQLKRLE